jgi:hypothetical protein
MLNIAHQNNIKTLKIINFFKIFLKYKNQTDEKIQKRI